MSIVETLMILVVTCALSVVLATWAAVYVVTHDKRFIRKIVTRCELERRVEREKDRKAKLPGPETSTSQAPPSVVIADGKHNAAVLKRLQEQEVKQEAKAW